MTKIDIVSGFLGAGKTTLIKKLLKLVVEDILRMYGIERMNKYDYRRT